MKRKVMKIADTTYVVSLPLKWARENNIKKGDELNYELSKNSITFEIKKEIEKKSIKIDATKESSFHRRIIHFLYKSGYDEIIIRFDDDAVLKEIEKVIPFILGFEIVDQGSDFCVLSSVSSEIEDKFDILLRRCFLSIKQLSEGIYNSLDNKDKLSDILILEKNIDRITDFLLRVIQKKGYVNSQKSFFIYVIIRDFEKIADFYRELTKEIINSNKIDTKTTECIKEVNEYFDKYYQLFYSQSKDINFMLKKYIDIEKILNKNDNMKINPILKQIAYTIEHLIGPYYEFIST